ncbi:polynucleotide 3'-phosphatase [Desmophyllum pertusum]|uniref:Polynucleotide 3'-phosphatase n=1 Tax=Desmophyllum pertusum TaxID=174260 RepID=A0A9W9ZXK0_9CNID|nr:polynucleotide 3'-phosphatase [Desmophyllum pertusum]
MEGGKFVCVAFFLAFLALCAGKPQEYVFLESSHDVEAWRVEGWEKQERLSPSEEVFLTFALKQSNLESLERFFWEVSDPRSSEDGNHFSLSNLTRLIAPSQATLTAVKAWLEDMASARVTVLRFSRKIS